MIGAPFNWRYRSEIGLLIPTVVPRRKEWKPLVYPRVLRTFTSGTSFLNNALLGKMFNRMSPIFSGIAYTSIASISLLRISYSVMSLRSSDIWHSVIWKIVTIAPEKFPLQNRTPSWRRNQQFPPKRCTCRNTYYHKPDQRIINFNLVKILDLFIDKVSIVVCCFEVGMRV